MHSVLNALRFEQPGNAPRFPLLKISGTTDAYLQGSRLFLIESWKMRLSESRRGISGIELKQGDHLAFRNLNPSLLGSPCLLIDQDKVIEPCTICKTLSDMLYLRAMRRAWNSSAANPGHLTTSESISDIQPVISKCEPIPFSSARSYTAAAAAISCKAVPVESKTVISESDVRPGLLPAMRSPSSA